MFDVPVFCLDFSRVFEHAHVDEQIFWWLETASEIYVCPLALVGGEEVAVLADVFFFLGAEAAFFILFAGLACSACVVFSSVGLLEDVDAVPAVAFELFGAHFVVCKQTSLVSAHT